MKVFVVHVYDAAGHLHDYSVHATIEGALRGAASDVVWGEYAGAVADFFDAEVYRVLDAVSDEEPGVGRSHVSCGAWRAHVDQVQVRS